MNLIEALERKKAINEIISDKTEYITECLNDAEVLSKNLCELDSLVDKFYSLERLVQKRYEETKISDTESISDVISYVDALSKKINILEFLLLTSNKNFIIFGLENEVDTDTVLFTIEQYKELRNKLVKKIKDVCFKTSLSASDI
jgi:hypothetical protein